MLTSLFSCGLRDAHLFVLAEVECHINANLQVTTMLDKWEKQKNKKETVMLAWLQIMTSSVILLLYNSQRQFR